MSSVATGQMSAVETGQMSAAETGQMSAVETRQMLKSQIRGRASQQQCGLSKARPSPNPSWPKFWSGPKTSNLIRNGSRIDGLARNFVQMNPKGCPEPSGPFGGAEIQENIAKTPDQPPRAAGTWYHDHGTKHVVPWPLK